MKRFLVVVGGLLACWAVVAGVEERLEARQLLEAFFTEQGGWEQAIAALPSDIENQMRICIACHGEGGNSPNREIPSLAGQNPPYFVEQMLVYQRAARYPEMMHLLSEQMEREGILAAALYFAIQPRRVMGEVDHQKGQQGAALYRAYCIHCHGEDGSGANPGYANLRGQRADYLSISMRRFRDRSERRVSHEMAVATLGLSDQQIEELAHYLAGQ